jgi:hypothetical protein
MRTTRHVWFTALLVAGVPALLSPQLRAQPAEAPVRPRTGIVALDSHSLKDNQGHFNGLGATYMTALWRAKHDRQRLRSDLQFLSGCGFHYIRVLSMVGWYSAWEGREIAPVSFQNRNGERIDAWSDYWRQLGELIDLAYDDYGLRTQLTIFADAQLMPDRSARIEHMRRILELIEPRQHKVILLEVANEAWQNGFPGRQGIDDLREFGKHLSDRTKVLVALSAPVSYENEGIIEMYREAPVDIATVHFSRDIRTPDGGWLPVRDPWRVRSIGGIPPVASNEPIGPGSSVAQQRDPLKLVCAAAVAWMSGLPMYVYHCDAGVFGQTRFKDQPGIGDFAAMQKLLPGDIANWTAHNCAEPGAPLRLITDADAPAPPRLLACTRGNDLVALAFALDHADRAQVRAQRDIDVELMDPLSGQVVSRQQRRAEQQLSIPPGAAAYFIKGRILN